MKDDQAATGCLICVFTAAANTGFLSAKLHIPELLSSFSRFQVDNFFPGRRESAPGKA